jgi:heme exporter protein A
MAADACRNMEFEVAGISHRFGLRKVLNGVSFRCARGESVCISGPNGSGKSTLLKIAAGVLRPSSGEINLSIEGKRAEGSRFKEGVRLVSPEMEMYAELTGLENLTFLSRIHGKASNRQPLNAVLERVGLGERGSDLYGEYSSGMKQRLKVAASLLGDPQVVMFDEPTANLDEDGKNAIYAIMRDILENCALVFATNEASEKKFGGSVVELG